MALNLNTTMTNATMRGVVWEGNPYSMNVVDIPLPTIMNQTDAIVQVTLAGICGTDLHTYHGIYGSEHPPWGMGHEAIGYISDIGDAVSSLTIGQKVIVPDNFADGHFDLGPSMPTSPGLGARYGDNAGCQSEYVRVPFADMSLMPIPTSGNATNTTALDMSYLYVSDIFATAWMGVTFSGFSAGDTVAVFGAGPVGLLAAYSAILRGASRVYVVDHVPNRLALGASIGAIPIDFTASDPVAQIMAQEPDGVTRSVDCVGLEALDAQLESQQNIVLEHMVGVTMIGGGLGGIGIYTASNNSAGTPLADEYKMSVQFPISDFFDKGLSYRAGPVDVKLVAPELIALIASGAADASFITSSVIGIEQAPEYYERFDQKLESKVLIQWPVEV